MRAYVIRSGIACDTGQQKRREIDCSAPRDEMFMKRKGTGKVLDYPHSNTQRIHMNLTVEQKAVVDLRSGSHLVLAPPGSGKTEMLSQRILNALENGIDPRRMLCATFTNRAAFEMRSRVTAEAKDKALPDVGNLHHFCHRFLSSIGRLYPGKNVLDEVQQCDFVKEVTQVLVHELKTGSSAEFTRTHGVSVIGLLGEMNDARRRYLVELLEKLFADARKHDVNPFAELLGGVLIVHQRRCGIPVQFRRPLPSALYTLNRENILYALDCAYCGLKRKFRSVDFDDLVNDTFLWLEENELAEERKFLWVQVDEVQDLNPIQWRIIEHVTSRTAVSVYFGDLEQAIFSFLGASIQVLEDATRHCERHYFKTNFRATPRLLEILMRFSIASMKSDWEFLPHPARADQDKGDLAIFRSNHSEDILQSVRHLLDSGCAENVALLVRTNIEADAFEGLIKPLGHRYAKVSGEDLFTFTPMRDFLAFTSLLTGRPTMDAWACLFRRFGHRYRSGSEARYFVRGMFAAGFNPFSLLRDGSPSPWMSLLSSGNRTAVWQWKHRRDLNALCATIKASYRRLLKRIDGHLTFREIFREFAGFALKDETRYASLRVPVAFIHERIEKFLRYTDHFYAKDGRAFSLILKEDWEQLTKLKEADLLVGDEKIVISTIHKAKGRQFDAVVIPSAADVLNPIGAIDPDDPLRLLYVAMSRAKRHLHVFGDTPCAALDPIRPCFGTGYRCYYTSESRTGDWLTTWEHLSGLLQIRQSLPPESAFVDPNEPVVLQRIKLKLLRFNQDAAAVARLCTALLERNTPVPDVVVRTLTATRQFSRAVFESVRSATLRGRSSELVRAASDYYRRLAGTRQQYALDGLEDLLYHSSGQVRLAAALDLASLGESRWLRLITGGSQDFERLADVTAPGHEFAIRQILATNPPAAYAARLREILFRRASR